MYDMENQCEGSEDRGMGSSLCGMSSLPRSVQKRWFDEAYRLYGNKGREILESIYKIKKFQKGYPKRIIISILEPNRESWQKFFDFVYNAICAIHGIDQKPTQNKIDL